MKTWLKVTLVIIILGIIGAGLGYKFIYNKPHRNYEKAKPDHVVTAELLFQEYRNEKQAAEQQYNGKVVQVSGTVSAVETTDSLTIAVFVLDEGMFGDEGIRCTMLPNYKEKIHAFEGKEAIIKGYLTGYNDTDVILEQCSLVN
jgi:calcineurin-like phosphoesterase